MINLNTWDKTSQTPRDRELSRLLAAAVINQRFCHLLLTYPAKALATGFNGESFLLPREVRKHVLSIRAKNITDFARQLVDIQP